MGQLPPQTNPQDSSASGNGEQREAPHRTDCSSRSDPCNSGERLHHSADTRSCASITSVGRRLPIVSAIAA
jgi:hypothetical protein